MLLGQGFFRLKEGRFREFSVLVDAPPTPNPGIDRLMAVEAPWAAGA